MQDMVKENNNAEAALQEAAAKADRIENWSFQTSCILYIIQICAIWIGTVLQK